MLRIAQTTACADELRCASGLLIHPPPEVESGVTANVALVFHFFLLTLPARKQVFKYNIRWPGLEPLPAAFVIIIARDYFESLYSLESLLCLLGDLTSGLLPCLAQNAGNKMGTVRPHKHTHIRVTYTHIYTYT
jgi:hypothetical protein